MTVGYRGEKPLACFAPRSAVLRSSSICRCHSPRALHGTAQASDPFADVGWINFEQGKRTNKRKGRIPIPPRLLPHLRRARLRGTDLGYVVNSDNEYIGDIKKGFEAACKRAGLQDVTPHVLKHTAITWAMQNRMDLWQAAGFFATSVPILIRVYGHHHPDFMREAAEAIGRASAECPRNAMMFLMRSE